MAQPNESKTGIWVALAGLAAAGIGYLLLRAPDASKKEEAPVGPPLGPDVHELPLPTGPTGPSGATGPAGPEEPHLRPKGVQKGQPILTPGERLLIVGDETVNVVAPELQKLLQNPVDVFVKTDGSTYTELYNALRDTKEMAPNTWDTIILMAGYNTAALPDPSTDQPGLQKLTSLLQRAGWHAVVLMPPFGPLNVPDGEAKFKKVEAMLVAQSLSISDLFFAILLPTSPVPTTLLKVKLENSMLPFTSDELEANGVTPTLTGATKAAAQIAKFLKAPQG